MSTQVVTDAAYNLGRLWAIAEKASPERKRHFAKFTRRPRLLLVQMSDDWRVREAWAKDEVREIMRRIPADGFPDIFSPEMAARLMTGYYHQQGTLSA